jgi:UDP-N-acetylmuramoyl-L-alanyl-D-glutamate--2,6-diaminopimelate ligase
MQAYAEAKARLFATESLKIAIVNYDDAYVDFMGSSCPQISYGLKLGADVRAANLQIRMTGSIFELYSPWGVYEVSIKTLGEFNIYNSLAIFTSLVYNGYTPNDVVKVLAYLPSSPGRMELVAENPCVIIDYAHTPDALEKVLSNLAKFKKAKLWVVFGCGGDRDTSKRPVMGAVVAKYADGIIITSDNPRSEDPELIIEVIASGMDSGFDNIVKIIDRKAAIDHVLNLAERDDIVLIAGKGHETYQQIGKQILNFSDKECVQNRQD